jgi:electron transport complex protein RnfD
MLSKFLSNPAPHVPSTGSVGRLMRVVIYALLPGSGLYVLFFGWGVAINILLATGSAVLFDGLMLALRQQPVTRYLSDGTAALTGLLLALSLPPMTPWWLPVTGSFIAIVVAKQLYGGLGYNPFNPAMAAFAVLLISFPKELSLWAAPAALQIEPLTFSEAWRFSLSAHLPGQLALDNMTAATSLDAVRTGLGLGRNITEIRSAAAFGEWAGRDTEWISLAYLVGGLALIGLRVISWHIPVAVISVIAVMAGLGYLAEPQYHPGVLLHLFGGATMLGAFFIATDPVTAATTPSGKLVYGAGIGVLIYAIRSWGGYPDGVAFAVLLMGMTVPLLDRYALPRIFGARRGVGRDQ